MCVYMHGSIILISMVLDVIPIVYIYNRVTWFLGNAKWKN